MKKAFTLVELIVVITILAILWTIAFISLQWYSRDARDSKRTTDVWNMKTSLELFNVNTWKYPAPDSFNTITYSWSEVIWYQWTLWKQVTTNLKQLDEIPLDPLMNIQYTYSTTNSYKEYEILALYEWNVAYNPVVNSVHAATTNLIPKVEWNYNQVFVKTKSYIIPIPSIITAEWFTWTWVLDLNSTNIKSQVTTNGTNIPQIWIAITKTWTLNINLAVYTGSITKKSTYIQKINVMKQIQQAYSWTNLVNNDTYLYILNQKTNQQNLTLTNTLFNLPISSVEKINPKDWKSAGSLALPRWWWSPAIIGDYVYLFGWQASSLTTTIQRALLSDPTNWQDTGWSLAYWIEWTDEAKVIWNYVYIFWGFTNHVQRAPISNPLNWTDLWVILPNSIFALPIKIIWDYIYIFGGVDGKHIWKAPISNPLSWTDLWSILPASAQYYKIFTINNYLYLLSGIDTYRASTSDPTNWSLLWTSSISLPNAWDGIIVGDYAYLLWGNLNDSIYKASINDMSNWQDTGYNMPFPLWWRSVIRINNSIYKFGGDDNWYHGNSSISKINIY